MAFDERLRSCLKLITADPSGSIAAMPADTGDAG